MLVVASPAFSNSDLNPCLPELQQLAGTDWVRLYDGPISQSHIAEAVTWTAAPRRVLNMKPFSWPQIAGETGRVLPITEVSFR